MSSNNSIVTPVETVQESNRLTNFFRSRSRKGPSSSVGILVDDFSYLQLAVPSIVKAEYTWIIINPGFSADKIKTIIDTSRIEIVITTKKFTEILNKLQWECKSFNTYLCLDTDDVYAVPDIERFERLEKQLWDYVGSKAQDEIAGGGWVSSYTGAEFTKQEMDEYASNVLQKLAPYLHDRTRVLEIACGTGIIMYNIAPKVALYYGTDISSVIIEKKP